MKKKLWILLAVGALTLSGCSRGITDSSRAAIVEPERLLTEATETPTFQTPLVAEPEGKFTWARDQLEPALQETYDRLNAAISCHQESPVEVEATMDEVQLALNALRMDHPEYFWFDGQAAYVSQQSILGEKLSCELSYTMTMQQAQEQLETVERYVSACLSSPEMVEAQDTYEKILGVYRYIINHTDYVTAETDQSFLSVMTRGQGTCAGYARTFQYLMHRLNIPCILALGYGEGGESHGWNLVQCDGDWYHVDVTWGDPVDNLGQPGNSLEYTYFMLTDEEIFRTHTPEGDIPLPQCSGTSCNYYRRSGLQLSQWDSVKYESLMRSAMNRGDTWLTVRFDTGAELSRAMAALIDNSGIITLFSNCGLPVQSDGITYSYNDIFYEFSVKIS